jgi:hypothetical protein
VYWYTLRLGESCIWCDSARCLRSPGDISLRRCLVGATAAAAAAAAVVAAAAAVVWEKGVRGRG